MPETHPFGNFVPNNSRYLILGSFTGKPENKYDWFYGTKRNQFWKILEVVYTTKLDTKFKKQKLFRKVKIAITDIILSCDRNNGTNSDANLTNTTYNIKAVNKILKENRIEKIFFTSSFAEKLFKKCFRDPSNLSSVTYYHILPSPSPRYAKLSLVQKIKVYKKLLPKWEVTPS